MAKTKGAVSVTINMEEVEKLASIGATQREMARWFGCSLSTIEKRLAEPKNRLIYERGDAKFDISIRRQQAQMLLGGSVAMAIWLGKQRLGQSDKITQDVTTHEGELTLEQLLATSRELLDGATREKT